MKKCVPRILIICILLVGLTALTGRLKTVSHSVPVLSPARFSGQTLIIDAGHGGEDGGAVSLSGAIESKINLAISLRLDAILGLYGVNTLMLRTEDISLHDSSAGTIREKKVSDIRNRVAAVEAADGATLISIHQNKFSGRQSRGAHVFYTTNADSPTFAHTMQETLRIALDPGNNRKAAKIPTSVYLMNHISCRAILVECGFLSNPTEDALLQSERYQTKIAAAIACGYLYYQQLAPQGGDLNE